MTQEPLQVGTVPFHVPTDTGPCVTFYKIIGDLSCGSSPVVVIHGGPGAGHEYLLPFADLWTCHGLPVVGNKSFWQESLLIDELENLIDHLQLREGPGYHILGQSWGGMLGAAFAARRPRGLQRLVLASALASKELSIRGTQLFRKQLPSEAQQALDEAEQKAEYDSPAYQDALGIFYRKHLCRTDPFPPEELKPCLRHLIEDKTVYGTMNGPSPLTSTGSLLGWTCIPRLPHITAPTFVYNGEYDTSHDVGTAPFFEHIPGVRWITFPDAGHMYHLEGGGLRKRIIRVVGESLTQHAA